MHKTLSQVQAILVQAGAEDVSIKYTAGAPSSVAFSILTAHGLRWYTLPANSEAVYATLVQQKLAPRFVTPEHAKRVAWRIIKDWLEAQLAIIEAKMVALDQVFLPYQETADGRTVYELYRENQAALPAPKSL